jgi:hypothetical protein
MRVTYREAVEQEFTSYRCRLSGRFDFDLTEAAHKARRLVRDGHAVDARVLDGELIAAQWVRRCGEVVQLSGPDL